MQHVALCPTESCVERTANSAEAALAMKPQNAESLYFTDFPDIAISIVSLIPDDTGVTVQGRES